MEILRNDIRSILPEYRIYPHSMVHTQKYHIYYDETAGQNEKDEILKVIRKMKLIHL